MYVVRARHSVHLTVARVLCDDTQQLVVQLGECERDAWLCADVQVLTLDLVRVRNHQVAREACQPCNLHAEIILK